jgi:carbon monoxide dehydrogenase subunit G
MNIESRISISKPIDEVFKFVAEDFFKTYHLWASPKIVNVKQLSDGPVDRDTKGRVTLSKKQEAEFQVTEFSLNEKLEFSYTSLRKYKAAFKFEPANNTTVLYFASDLEYEGLKKLFKAVAVKSDKNNNQQILENIKTLLEAWDEAVNERVSLFREIERAQSLLDKVVSNKINPHDDKWRDWDAIREHLLSLIIGYITSLQNAGRNPNYHQPVKEEISTNLDQFYACILSVLAMDLIGLLNRKGGWNMDVSTANARDVAGRIRLNREWLLESLAIKGSSWSKTILELEDFGKQQYTQIKTPIKFLDEAKRLAPNQPFVKGCNHLVLENWGRK